jgi:Zn-dependent metalloprotease
MSEDKTEGREVPPSINPEERSNLEDYKSKDKASNTSKTTDFDSVTTVPIPEGDVQVETKLEIPVEDNKEDVKSEAKSPKVKKSSEEEPSITTVSKEKLSQRSKKEEYENKNEIISSKMSKFGKGFKIPDDK